MILPLPVNVFSPAGCRSSAASFGRYVRGLASGLLATSMLLSPLTTSASPLDAADAKASADAAESALTSDQAQRLVKAQGALASTAFPRCLSRSGGEPANFTVIVELDATGTVQHSWLIGESDFSRCFRDAMAKNFAFQAPTTPFFTSFEYSRALK